MQLDFMGSTEIRTIWICGMKGLENISFNECLSMASIADLEGVEVPFLHISHLIENKKKVNRPKDQVDVIELEKIRKIREEGS